MLKALEAAGVTSGSIGVINVNAATDSCVMREEGFRSAFEGKGYTISRNTVRRGRCGQIPEHRRKLYHPGRSRHLRL